MKSGSEARWFVASVKVVTPILAVATFGWGIYTYKDASRLERERRQEEAWRNAETRRIEATRPYLDRQLTLYTEVTRLTATIVTSLDSSEIEKATNRFYELYWGELALVEHGQVEGAMVAFREALEGKRPGDDLGQLALRLAHACRDELAASWGTDAWKR